MRVLHNVRAGAECIVEAGSDFAVARVFDDALLDVFPLVIFECGSYGKHRDLQAEGFKMLYVFILFMDATEEYKKFLWFIEKIVEKHVLVVVEGKKDKRALNTVGVENVIVLDALYKTVELVENEKEVVLLVDLDKEGKKIYSKLNDVLVQHGVVVDNRFREFLFKNTQLRQIEGMVHYLNQLTRKV